MKGAWLWAASAAASSQFPPNVTEFCAERPLGLYCSPWSIFQKIECPTGDIVTCKNAPNEFCQERGVLKKYGYKGGVARCVPHLDAEAVASFCEQHPETGVYCWGDTKNNIRVQCPTGLIYKCDDHPTADTKKCNQTTSTFANCVIGGGGGIADACSAIVVNPVTITETATVTKHRRVTVTHWEPCVVTYAETNAHQSTGSVVASTQILTQTSTGLDVTTGTLIAVETSTNVYELTSTLVDYSTPVATVTSTWFTVLTSTISSTSVSTTATSSSGGGVADMSVVILTPTISTGPTTTQSLESSTLQAIVTPTPASCTNGQSPVILSPPGESYSLVLTSEPGAEQLADATCRSMNGRLAPIKSTSEHWWIGQQICSPVWYQTWDSNNYGPACLALYPGGATAVPNEGCNASLLGLCAV